MNLPNGYLWSLAIIGNTADFHINRADDRTKSLCGHVVPPVYPQIDRHKASVCKACLEAYHALEVKHGK